MKQKRTDGYIEEHVFGNFQNFREPRCQVYKLGPDLHKASQSSEGKE